MWPRILVVSHSVIGLAHHSRQVSHLYKSIQAGFFISHVGATKEWTDPEPMHLYKTPLPTKNRSQRSQGLSGFR